MRAISSCLGQEIEDGAEDYFAAFSAKEVQASACGLTAENWEQVGSAMLHAEIFHRIRDLAAVLGVWGGTGLLQTSDAFKLIHA